MKDSVMRDSAAISQALCDRVETTQQIFVDAFGIRNIWGQRARPELVEIHLDSNNRCVTIAGEVYDDQNRRFEMKWELSDCQETNFWVMKKVVFEKIGDHYFPQVKTVVAKAGDQISITGEYRRGDEVEWAAIAAHWAPRIGMLLRYQKQYVDARSVEKKKTGVKA